MFVGLGCGLGWTLAPVCDARTALLRRNMRLAALYKCWTCTLTFNRLSYLRFCGWYWRIWEYRTVSGSSSATFSAKSHHITAYSDPPLAGGGRWGCAENAGLENVGKNVPANRTVWFQFWISYPFSLPKITSRTSNFEFRIFSRSHKRATSLVFGDAITQTTVSI